MRISRTPLRHAAPALAALAGWAALAAPAWAQQDAQALRTRALAATCANCHGTEGRAIPGSSVPGLAGQPAAQTVQHMKAFRDGSRPATVMHQLAKGYSDAQIEQIAAYFAARPR